MNFKLIHVKLILTFRKVLRSCLANRSSAQSQQETLKDNLKTLKRLLFEWLRGNIQNIDYETIIV